MNPSWTTRRSLLASAAAWAAGPHAHGSPGPGVERVRAVGTHFARVFEPSQGEIGPPRGLAVDLLRRLLGAGVEFELQPYLRAQQEVEAGDADILIGPYRTPEREARFLFSQRPFYEDAMVLYARRGEPPLWDGRLMSLERLTLGVVRGWTYGSAFEALRPQLPRLTTVTTVRSGLAMLKLGRLDVLASNERNSQGPIDELGLRDHVQVLQPPLDVLRGHFGFPRTHRGLQLKARYDEAFEALLKGNAFSAMTRVWGLRPPL